MKGFLAWRGFEIPRTHDLEELQRQCLQEVKIEGLSALDLTELSGYAVELRYDAEFWPPQATAGEALEVAGKVKALILGQVPDSAKP